MMILKDSLCRASNLQTCEVSMQRGKMQGGACAACKCFCEA
jgi:hypothetical protein